MIKQYIDILENLITESHGLGVSLSGEEFVRTNNSNEKIYVDLMRFYPENTTELTSYEEMTSDLKNKFLYFLVLGVNLFFYLL